MVAVVVHDHVAVAAILDFKTPPRAAEGLQRLGDPGEGHAEFRSQRDDADGVALVVPAGDVERDRTERFAAAQHAEVRLEIFRMHVIEAVKSGARLAIRDRSRMSAAHARRMAVVRGVDDLPARLTQQLIEDHLDRREVGVIVEVLFLDVQHDGVLGMVKRQRAVAFITLSHKKLTLRIPVRIRPQDRNLRADVMRRMQPADFQHMGRHG